MKTCPVCSGPTTTTTRTLALRHGKLEVKITYCHDIDGCGFQTLDTNWLWHNSRQEATDAH